MSQVFVGILRYHYVFSFVTIDAGTGAAHAGHFEILQLDPITCGDVPYCTLLGPTVTAGLSLNGDSARWDTI